jgi:hypothetical protein
MQIELQITEARASELKALINQPPPDSAIPEGTTIQIIPPVAFGAGAGDWKVRLSTGLTKAAEIATLLTFLMAVPGVVHPDPVGTQPEQTKCEVTLTRGQTKVQAQFPCSTDSSEVEAIIGDFMAKNGQPDRLHARLVRPHQEKKQ